MTKYKILERSGVYKIQRFTRLLFLFPFWEDIYYEPCPWSYGGDTLLVFNTKEKAQEWINSRKQSWNVVE